MTLGSFLCVLQMRDESGRPVEGIADPVGSGAQSSGPRLRADDVHVQPRRAFRRSFGFRPKFLVFDAATRAGLFPLAVAGAVGSVVGAYYYLKIVETMGFDEPARLAPRRISPVEGGLIALSATCSSRCSAISPSRRSGWSASRRRTRATSWWRRRAPPSVAVHGSTNTDMLALRGAANSRGTWLRARAAGGRARPPRPPPG